jgi:YidC/Oxa1 family membrane protein insertase
MAFLNDPQGGKQQRNLMISVALIFGVLLVWQAFMAPNPAEQAANQQQQQAQTEEGSDETGSSDAQASNDNDTSGDSAAGSAEPADSADPLPPQRIVTEHLDLQFTNVGARAANATVTAPEQYIPSEDELEIFPQLAPCEDGTFDCAATTTGLKNEKLPLSIRLKGFNELRENAVYEFDEQASSCDENSCSEIVYTWTSNDGSLVVERRFSPAKDKPFGVHGQVVVRNEGANDRAFDALELVNYSTYTEQAGGFLGGLFNQSATVVEGICHADGDAETKPSRKLDELRSFNETIRYGGFNERYFLSAFGFTDTEGEDVDFADYCEYMQTEDNPGEELYSLIGTDSFTVGAGTSKQFDFTWYVGPKRIAYLDQYAPHEFKDSVQYGIFSFLSVPIRHVLVFLQGLVGNWGLAIIFLTIAIKAVLLPITTKAYKSMEAMKRVQPKLEKLKEKYENDQQKLAEKQMELFREEGVNPLGGCLPLLLQMPVYFALYRTIWNSAELYNASFVLWIQDLSQPDPYYILPVVLGVIMFGQQKLMPNTSSNPQMKMMQYIMPLMFIPIMLFLPSGLVLYIFCNMVLTILQQLFIRNRYVTDEKA